MDLTKEQLSELICKHSERENGLHDLMEIILESLMVPSVMNTSSKKGNAATSATATVRGVLTVTGGS